MRLCKHQLAGATLDLRQRNLAQQRDRIVIELPPAHRIEVAEQARGVVVPTPPEIARERPEAFLGRSDEAIERAGFADDGRHLGGGFDQHAHFIFVERSRASIVWTTSTPCSTPRSMSGTPRKDW